MCCQCKEFFRNTFCLTQRNFEGPFLTFRIQLASNPRLGEVRVRAGFFDNFGRHSHLQRLRWIEIRCQPYYCSCHNYDVLTHSLCCERSAGRISHNYQTWIFLDSKYFRNSPNHQGIGRNILFMSCPLEETALFLSLH